MSFVIKADARTGQVAWVKAVGDGYQLGPRENAALFETASLARIAISQMPNAFLNSGVRFSIEPVDAEPAGA